MRKKCPYESCRLCGGCAVCGDFHGGAYGGCTEHACPYTWLHSVRDWFRRTFFGPFVPPWEMP